jgi:hypothetical protein
VVELVARVAGVALVVVAAFGPVVLVSQGKLDPAVRVEAAWAGLATLAPAGGG